MAGNDQRLLGRSDECEALDGLIEAARAGQSQVLVLRGEAGVGKTALLNYAADRAAGFRAAQATGVEADVDLAFAGLHQLCAPLLDSLDRLPGPQRDALATAFGQSAGPAPDRFLVGLAVLSLMSEATQDQPLMCVIDDAQWLDQVSAQTLAFVARRLLAEPVALVFAVRDGHDDELKGLPELVIRGLPDGHARALLDSVVRGRMDERVRERIIAEARGNPLALLELPRDPAAAEGGFGRPDARAPSGHIEQSFVRRVQSLPMPTQKLLLAAAAEPVGDKALLIRAARRMGITPDVAAQAEAEGLIEIGTRVRFRHPLMRSAAYLAADIDDRRKAHRALAEETDPESDPDRRAWHGANAALGTDDEVADELERSADRAAGRGGVAAAAAFLERATELTADPARRGARALAAAEAKFAATSSEAAYGLLAIAEMSPLDDLQRAQTARLRARIAFVQSRGGGDGGAPPVADTALGLLTAARGLEGLDDALARETYLDALGAAMYAGRLCPYGGPIVVAEPARHAPPGPQPPRPNDLLLDGLAMRFTDGHAASLPTLRAAMTQVLEAGRQSDGDVMRLFWQGFPIAQECAAGELWDDDLWKEVGTTSVRLAREAGALAMLPLALATRAGTHVFAGEFDAAAALIEEADTIAAATGYAPVRYHAISLAVWRGAEAEAMRMLEATTELAASRGEGRVTGLIGCMTAILHNGRGRYEEALRAAKVACEHEDLGPYRMSLAELIEAAVRCGEPEVAAEAAARMESQAAAGTDWVLGTLARCRALVADDDTAEGFYREAIDRLGRTRMRVYLARSHLVYGEWLRREHRRVDAREQLGIAHEMFVRMGAEAFAERARRELLVTGEKTRKHTVGSGEGLTAQEAQIAALAGTGLTNQEIGAQLFISAHTVEWHLRKVFAKLGIKSRRQLRGRPEVT